MIWYLSIDNNHSTLPASTLVFCSLSKGIENGSLLTPFEILEEELPGKVTTPRVLSVSVFLDA